MKPVRVKRLPKHSPQIILQWGVCTTYQDLEHLDSVVSGKSEVDAEDILALDISAADRVWVLLRRAFLPAPVLQAVMQRIFTKTDVFETARRSRTRLAFDRATRKHDYWRAAQRVACAAVEHHDPGRTAVVATYDTEYERQLQIIREEITSWLND